MRLYNMRESAKYLETHGKLFKDQGISFDITWAENDELKKYWWNLLSKLDADWHNDGEAHTT